uniref:BOWMAN_BIRK domain-containing protein n=1 Tax=Globodera pallida TaxID=36090 RepID=A0A183C1U7_GLOPA
MSPFHLVVFAVLLFASFGPSVKSDCCINCFSMYQIRMSYCGQPPDRLCRANARMDYADCVVKCPPDCPRPNDVFMGG